MAQPTNPPLSLLLTITHIVPSVTPTSTNVCFAYLTLAYDCRIDSFTWHYNYAMNDLSDDPQFFNKNKKENNRPTKKLLKPCHLDYSLLDYSLMLLVTPQLINVSCIRLNLFLEMLNTELSREWAVMISRDTVTTATVLAQWEGVMSPPAAHLATLPHYKYKA